MPSKKIENLKPSNFETIDAAMLKWVDETLNIFSTTNDGWKKVPVVWLTAERAFQIKHKKDMRSNDSQSLIFPMITIEREGVTKTEVSQRPIPGNIFPVNDRRRNSFYVSRKINQAKTKDFANADRLKAYGQPNFPVRDRFGRKKENQKIVYEYKYMPMPVYYDLSYSINLRADYQQQMNEMMSPFMTFAGGINQFIIERDGHTYEAFIESTLPTDNNLSALGEEEKKYETAIKIKVLGFIVGSGENQEQPKIGIRENRVQLRFQREKVILGDINEYSINDGKEKEPYRG